MNQDWLPESVVECTPERVVVRLNRVPFRRHPLKLAAAVVVGLTALVALLAVAIADYLSPLQAAAVGLLLAVIVLRNLLVDLTLIADGPLGRVWLESRSLPHGRARRKMLCTTGDTRSVFIRCQIDVEDVMPYQLHSLHAETASGEVLLCDLGDRRSAEVVGETLARLLGCRWRNA